MKNISLAARYRPQTFAEVAGQEMVTTVLSRAAAEDRVAPAYLLSGTRGVGKTTIARILAKALNCVHAPGPEPCNQCDQCRKITQGSHVDVTEIDGASNNSVEDARALRENIGYAPMEGRYKVFIIDEAHMLSRSAFNALLKTLEEPPPRVVFIFATTEAHKFPITIVSRCQHFIFKRLPEAGLMAHLTRVLQQENIPFEENAVRLLARRAAGSVRDGMSLLGQTLALGGDALTVEATRNVLGLAGQELFLRLLDALAGQDCVAVTVLLRELLDQGVDIGFFLRELTGLWRTLFLLRQAGEAVLPALDLPEDEARLWLTQAPRFSAAHIHAAWQMVLDAQRRVIHSPEPAAALELLLLNLALLPRLLPLDRLPTDVTPENAPARGTGTSSGHPPSRSAEPGAALQPVTAEPMRPAPVRQAVSPKSAAPVPKTAPSPDIQPSRTPQPVSTSPAVRAAPPHSAPGVSYDTESASPPPPDEAEALSSGSEPQKNAVDKSVPSTCVPDWEEFRVWCAEPGRSAAPQHLLRQIKGVFSADTLTLTTDTATLYEHLEQNRTALAAAAKNFCGRPVNVCILPPAHAPKTDAELKEEFAAREELRYCREFLDASIIRVRPVA